MDFFSRIRSWFIWATNVLVNWALFFYGWGGIGDWIGDLCRDLSDFTSEVAGYFWDASNWWEEVEDAISDILSWSNIRSLIRSTWPGLDDAITFFENLVDEFLVFAEDPIKYLKDKFESHVLPWAIDNIPFFGTLYTWYTNFKTELELFFDNPGNYLKDKFETVILPWAIENIPFLSTLYVIYTRYAGEFGVFLDDPILWLRGKFEDDILPWAQENIPFFAAITVLIDTITDEMVEFLRDPLQWLRDNTIWGSVEEFFADPLGWLESRFTDWFLGAE